mgnify:CR=1 FL=1
MRLKNIISTAIIPLLVTTLAFPVYASGDHKPPEPAPVNVPDDGSNHNALAIGLFIAAAVCIWKRCYEKIPEKDENPNRITPKE